MRKRIAVLISGGGTNLQSIIDACDNNALDAEIVAVISNKKNAFGLIRAENSNIETVYIGKKNYPDFEERSQTLIRTLEDLKVDLIVLAGYLEILHEDLFKKFGGMILNVHPSLIPKYAGKGFYGMKVHEAVIENKEKFSGATVHFVDQEVDTGQIVMQEAIRINEHETPESLQKRVLEIEHRILVSSIDKFIKGEI